MICNKKRTIWTFSLLLGLLLAVGTGTVIGHRETALWKARAGEAFGQALHARLSGGMWIPCILVVQFMVHIAFLNTRIPVVC